MSKILYLLEMMNGAEGISDIEGKATRVGASERGQRTSFNGADGISDIEHVAIGNGAFGESDIEGKAAVGSGENGAVGTRAT